MSELMNANTTSISNTGYIEGFRITSSALPVVISDYSERIISSTDNEATCLDGKYSVFEIANWFLTKESMTHKKLQKLCYYAQAWCYAIKGFRLEKTDYQAWVHGPVSPVLYERFRSFGYDKIRIKGNYNPIIEKEDQMFLGDVWETYGDRTGNALEALSHRELPWIEARRGYRTSERCTIIITPESMISYYRSIYNGN